MLDALDSFFTRDDDQSNQILIEGDFKFYIEPCITGELPNSNTTIKIKAYSSSEKMVRLNTVCRWYKVIIERHFEIERSKNKSTYQFDVADMSVSIKVAIKVKEMRNMGMALLTFPSLVPYPILNARLRNSLFKGGIERYKGLDAAIINFKLIKAGAYSFDTWSDFNSNGAIYLDNNLIYFNLHSNDLKFLNFLIAIPGMEYLKLNPVHNSQKNELEITVNTDKINRFMSNPLFSKKLRPIIECVSPNNSFLKSSLSSSLGYFSFEPGFGIGMSPNPPKFNSISDINSSGSGKIMPPFLEAVKEKIEKSSFLTFTVEFDSRVDKDAFVSFISLQLSLG